MISQLDGMFIFNYLLEIEVQKKVAAFQPSQAKKPKLDKEAGAADKATKKAVVPEKAENRFREEARARLIPKSDGKLRLIVVDMCLNGDIPTGQEMTTMQVMEGEHVSRLER